ncbi:hypothetical protein jhhlp_001327 [Lomentospora prolificans]|uniref:AB hydrolase-1 domain-containing protein n=1 Tax=Lomentospora prolificans TaxID=41688 RepID=A0A2N3NHZ9_9PEZI|nr:hypothetical protein jhhlp_001327 [Lomentospora prolificans]
MSPAVMPSPARLISEDTYSIPGKWAGSLLTPSLLIVTDLSFEVPLNHENPASKRIHLFGRAITHNDRPPVPIGSPSSGTPGDNKPWLVYLHGGPGFGNGLPQDSPLVRENLHHSYRILLLDYRGTGLSTPVSVSTIPGDSTDDKVAYLRFFRQDSIVKDLEAVRLCITENDPPVLKRWAILGQSFGGFVSTTYLSFYPDGLREVFLTGGIPPVGIRPEKVYEATFRKLMERNIAYYKKFPGDIAVVNYIASHIHQQGGIQLPGGGHLTVPRLLTMGLAFGAHDGFQVVHSLLTKMKLEITQFGHLSRSSLSAMELDIPFDTNPIYAILHEAIYCYGPGVASNWAALRVGCQLPVYDWLLEDYPGPVAATDAVQKPLFFSGEMVFPFHFDTYPELMSLKEVAQKLAEYDEWPQLYDEEQLARNQVPVYAVSYVDDMYVDFDLARQTARKIRGIKVFETNALYHNAVRAKSNEVIGALMKLREDTLD